ncbi:MAG: ATP-binding cassette domain-containing protein [Candidatus Eisenbacteria bacterium]|uniref:ATP-binding cassette domain-containing protein n=1 Tax=Eiseniibacteriota bacterium TaxID=2212470 RepID=A0A956NFP4_UNCEI|nr:ATP-binding cassette domain-containing protein [Candidatus Eisenbacteria bacterium]MCB9463773.1 ATP-binding cassette domain-containing protein [Candidatus Eisenbacteria bacterium]
MTEALRLEGVSKAYGSVQAVHPMDLLVPRGAIYGLLGPNGAGKTTTIRMIMDIIKPDTGRITLLGESDPEHRRDRIGYLPEERGIYRKLKVRELLVYLARLRSVPGQEAKVRANRWLERFSLSERAEDKVESLSKGNAQKVQFIATVLHQPEAVILDEPFSGFDPVNVDLVKNILLELREEGMTIIFSTHQMETVEKLCDSICLIHQGRKVLDGPLAQVKSERGTGAIQIEYDGRPSFHRDASLVARFDDSGRFLEVIPADGVSPQQILEAAARELQIRRFQVMEPSLQQIFLEAVGVVGEERKQLSALVQ